MEGKQLGVGVIGAGEIAVQTVEAMDRSPLIDVVAVADVRADMARDLAERFGVPAFTGAAELLGHPAVEAAYIAVPHYLHAPLTIQAAAAGKHVLCEKPIATTLDDADRMIRACRDANVTLDVTYDAQTSPGLRTVRDLIAEGMIGDIIGASMTQLIDKPARYWTSGWTGRVATDWRASREKSGGGILVMNGSYDINTVRYLTSLEAVRVYAESGTFDEAIEVEELLCGTIRYDNGAIGQMEYGSRIRGGEEKRTPAVRLFGRTGQVVIAERPMVFLTDQSRDYIPDQWQEIGVTFERYARQPIVDGFAEAVLSSNRPPVTGEDARAVLEIVDAAYRSSDTGTPVELQR